MNIKTRAAIMLVTFCLILSVTLVSVVNAKDPTINFDKVENLVEITHLIEKEISKSTDSDQIVYAYSSDFLWSPDGSKILVLIKIYFKTKNTPSNDITPIKCGKFGLQNMISSLFWMNADGTGLTDIMKTEESLRTAKNSTASRIESAWWNSDGYQIVLKVSDSCEEKPLNYRVLDQRGHIRVELKNLSWSPLIQWNNDRSKIAIIDAKDNNQLHIIDIKKSSIKQVQLIPSANPSAIMYDMTWSPDGKKIAYIGYKDGEIYTINTENSLSKKLTTDMKVEELSWKPDGKKLVFLTNDGIYVVDVDGDKPAVIEKGTFSLISWSPDGKELLFINGKKDLDNLYALNVDNMTIKLVASAFNINYITWSPDSNRIAFRSGYSSNIYTVSLDGTGKVTLPDSYSTNTRTKTIPGVEGIFGWGPDNKIYYINNNSLVKIKPDGTGLIQLVNYISSDAYSYNKIYLSPDGSRVLFTIGSPTRKEQVYILKMKGYDEVMSIYASGSIKPGEEVFIEVKSMSKPVDNATVFLNGRKIGKTNETGFLKYSFKEAGNQRLSAVKQGFRTANMSMTIKEQSPEEQTAETATPAPTVVDNTPITPGFSLILAVIALILTIYQIKKMRRIK